MHPNHTRDPRVTARVDHKYVPLLTPAIMAVAMSLVQTVIKRSGNAR
jgi:hypothetical protein